MSEIIQKPFLVYHYDWRANAPRDERAGLLLSADADCVAAGIAGDRYGFVASVEDMSGTLHVADALEEVYRLTNSIDAAWYQQQERGFSISLSAAAAVGARSTSVGDLIVHEDQVYVVAGAGFQKLDVSGEKLPTPQFAASVPAVTPEADERQSASRRGMKR